MTRPFEVRLPLEQAYLRNALFAVELVDAVTLERVSDGVKVSADGLTRAPVVNAGGLFVWMKEDLAALQRVSIDPGVLPYEKVVRTPGQLNLPPAKPSITVVELPPRLDYAFGAGITGLRGSLVEERLPPPQRMAGVPEAEVFLRWLDADGLWHDGPTVSPTNAAGDFVSILRLAPNDVPFLDSSALTVRLRVRRGAANERGSLDLKLPQGRVADPSTFAQGPAALKFAWDELQP